MPSSRPRGNSNATNQAARVSTAPMSERQQMALVMQLTSQTQPPGQSTPPSVPAPTIKRNERGETALHLASMKGDVDQVKKILDTGIDPSVTDYAESTSQRNQHSGKSRDDKKNSAGDDSSTAGCNSAMMDSAKSDDKNDSKDTSGNSDKTSTGQANLKNDESSGSSNLASTASNQEDATSSGTQGTKRNFSETSDSTDTVIPEEEGTKRKKRKDSDSSKDSSKSNQQSRGNAGRNGLASGCKPPGPASKTGVAPLSKGGQSQGSGGKSGGSNAQSKGGHGQGNQGKNSGNSGCKGNASGNQSSSGKASSGNQGKSQSSGLSAGQSGKGMSDKKSPCASPKPATFSQNKDDPDADDNKTVDTPGPKVPPLKIVIPGGVGGAGGSGNQQEGEGGSTQRGSTKNRGGNSTLPYILQTSSDNMSNADGNELTENTKDDKRQSSSDDKPGVPGQRVLRSHRNADGAEKDKERGRNSPHVSNSSSCNPSTSGKSHHSNQQSNDNNENNSNSANAGTSGGGVSSSGSGSSAGSSGQSSSNSGNSQAVWDGVFQVPSVDFHPRKRKIKSSKESHSHHQSSSDSTHGSAGESHSLNINPQFNSYQMHINVKKQIERRLKGLFPVQPKPPQGFKDYLMNRCSYVLKNNAKQQPPLKPPPTLPPQMREEFSEQENERHNLRVQHLVEKEKLVLAVEQEILRVHGRAARALANQALPFSVCSVLKDKEVYNMLTPEQEEKERNAQRSRYNGRLFLSWLQDVDDKWEKIKESMVKRHHTEAQSLYASQSMSWSWRLEELGLCDHKTTQLVDQGHVPKVNVSDDFDLLPA